MCGILTILLAQSMTPNLCDAYLQILLASMYGEFLPLQPRPARLLAAGKGGWPIVLVQLLVHAPDQDRGCFLTRKESPVTRMNSTGLRVVVKEVDKEVLEDLMAKMNLRAAQTEEAPPSFKTPYKPTPRKRQPTQRDDDTSTTTSTRTGATPKSSTPRVQAPNELATC